MADNSGSGNSGGGGNTADTISMVSNTASAGGSILGLFAAGKVRKRNEMWEKYRNNMRRIQEGINQDALTTKQIYSDIDFKAKQLANEIQYAHSAATQEVKAAVQGFSGRTSKMMQNALVRAKQLRTVMLERQQDRANAGIDSARLNAAFRLETSLEDGWVQPPDYMGTLQQAGQQAAAAAAASDRDVKENVVQTGEHNGLPIYQFNYIGDPTRYEGVMAQDVLNHKPEAVSYDDNKKHYIVDYALLGIEMKEVE